ncbi:MAG: aminotransferase class I/II-fold pyridoxal phosphate-dependent enzyme [Bacteroidetes bacterium]|nr:aminotransferase class I/II-fold pyridoxal phosphate-dependent enzyme [Bacteroidota bacterium]
MSPEEFRKNAHELVDWMADYLANPEKFPVKSQLQPGDLLNALPAHPPEKSEPDSQIFADFKDQIMPGISHWQHPMFMAYFPANSSYPSVLAEMLTATLGAQCMLWETSPAATELEQVVMTWLAEMTGLPDGFHGVIQDSASSSTLIALMCAREKATGFRFNEEGSNQVHPLVVYGSTQTHSSIEKAVKLAGIGRAGYRQIAVKPDFTLDPEALEAAIREDIRNRKIPCAVVATIGTTGTTAIDPVREIGEICRRHGVWLHVDAAYAGSALVLPEFRWMGDGLELADSLVFNPHKWMFTNFDCSAFFIKDTNHLVNVMSVLPEYLRTQSHGKVNNYSDWSIQLGRRFRALKLWWVIRSFGVDGIREKLRFHINLARLAERTIRNWSDSEILAPSHLNLICFRFRPAERHETDWNSFNEEILKRVNASGKLYLSHTRLNGIFTLRMVIGQTNVTEDNVNSALDTLMQVKNQINSEPPNRK